MSRPLMTTVRIDRFGGPDVLALHEVPVPEPGPGQILVRVITVLPLERAADAHRLLENREATGKIVLKPWSR